MLYTATLSWKKKIKTKKKEPLQNLKIFLTQQNSFKKLKFSIVNRGKIHGMVYLMHSVAALIEFGVQGSIL